MSIFCCVVAVIFTICHVVNAGSLTRQCHASNGTCAKRGNTCETAYGSGWTNIGKCCRGEPCCKFQCEDLQPQPNGMVSVNGRHIGNVANFSCKSPFELRGSQSLRCTDSGWDDDIPICYACPGDNQVSFNDKIYSVTCSNDRYGEALLICSRRGQKLPSVETREEQVFLKRMVSLIKSRHDWWIGLSDINTEDTFVWVSGQPLTYTDWYQGTLIQPDNRRKSGAGSANCAALIIKIQKKSKIGRKLCNANKIMIISWVKQAEKTNVSARAPLGQIMLGK
ncbi:Hypothetical predicted protein [Mytilus galloprovincialis]|uniref:Uncharacterized protein n=1 Tax=Mytilus galloprovincialis TaxID=29158 RepID=A0A8B6CHW6_MYTGA|nr:Hypothetical predicted protein [Mytilus galloprovincialis]